MGCGNNNLDYFATTPGKIKAFKFWCQKVLPLVYDDSLSYYELLCKVVDYINSIINNLNDLIDVQNQHSSEITWLTNMVNYLNGELEKVKQGEYLDEYIDALGKWIDENLQELVSRIVKYVFFGLTDDGYFVAYIPPAWDFLEFDTPINPDNPNYGHLILNW